MTTGKILGRRTTLSLWAHKEWRQYAKETGGLAICLHHWKALFAIARIKNEYARSLMSGTNYGRCCRTRSKLVQVGNRPSRLYSRHGGMRARQKNRKDFWIICVTRMRMEHWNKRMHFSEIWMKMRGYTRAIKHHTVKRGHYGNGMGLDAARLLDWGQGICGIWNYACECIYSPRLLY